MLPTARACLNSFTALALACIIIGCGAARREPPTTYSAIGKVVFKGGRPFPGGIISFTSKSDPSRTMDGPIADDGTFALSLIFDNKTLAGAVEGACQVMVGSRFDASKKGTDIYVLPETYTIEPKNNTFLIEVDPALAK